MNKLALLEIFFQDFAKSLANNAFVKLSATKAKGINPKFEKLILKPINTKKGPMVYFDYHFATKTESKLFSYNESVQILKTHLKEDFRVAVLHTLAFEFQIEINKKGKVKGGKSKASFTEIRDLNHNRSKNYLIPEDSLFLKVLGISSENGKVKADRQAKYRQINKFIEVTQSLLPSDFELNRDSGDEFSVVDMGSGKGYLTFALYEFLQNQLKVNTHIKGIELREDLVQKCNIAATKCNFENLKFIHQSIEDFKSLKINMLIALHACNTATDAAIAKGIKAGADLIICSPCCHKEIRPQLKETGALNNLMNYGILLERQAEIVTDGLRAMYLKKYGYKTKVFEFVSTEHTGKNVMITAQKNSQLTSDLSASESIQNEIEELKNQFGIKHFALEKYLV